MQQDARPYLVVDLEATCCDDGSIPRDEMETIEIGAMFCLPVSFEVRWSCSLFVQPVRHPTLTDFCKNLTGIQQWMVDDGRPFPEVFASFWDFVLKLSQDIGPPVFCSWGRFDAEQFNRDFAYHHLDSPLGEHLDLSGLFKQKTGRKRGHRGAMKYFGLVPDGRHHRGVDDAQNIVKLLPFLLN